MNMWYTNAYVSCRHGISSFNSFENEEVLLKDGHYLYI